MQCITITTFLVSFKTVACFLSSYILVELPVIVCLGLLTRDVESFNQ